MESLTDAQLSDALLHTLRKASTLRECRMDCLPLDAAAAQALSIILGETLRHASLLEQALRRRRCLLPNPTLFRSRCLPALQPGIRSRIKGRTPGAYFDTLIREEGLALTRQSLLLETAQGADADLLRCITEEEAVQLRLLHTLAGRF